MAGSEIKDKLAPENFGINENIVLKLDWIGAMVTQLYKFTTLKNHCIVHFKVQPFMICELDLIKLFKKKKLPSRSQ